MIIFPPALVVSEAASGTPLTHGRIGIHTFTRGALASKVTASGSVSGSPADAPLRPDTGEVWQAPSLPATWQFDNGSIKDVNYVGIAGHDLATYGVSVKAETSEDASVWEALALEHTPTNNAPIMLLDDVRQAKYLRLTFSGLGSAPHIGSIYVGKTIDMPRPVYGGVSPLNLSRETNYRTAVSQGGQFLGRSIQRMGVRGKIHFRHLLASWYRSTFDPFIELSRLYPFFYAWRPQTFPNEVVYVWTVDDVAPSNMGTRDFMEVGLSVQGIGYVA